MSYRPDAATDDGFARRTALFYAAYFVFAGLHLPFLPVWLEARGLDAAEIGIVLAAGMAARPLVVPVATRLADRRGWLKDEDGEIQRREDHPRSFLFNELLGVVSVGLVKVLLVRVCMSVVPTIPPMGALYVATVPSPIAIRAEA